MPKKFKFLLKLNFIFGILILKTNAEGGRKLGDECIPGKCSAPNSNCKWNGNIFKCVCKDKFIAINQTHCGHPISNIEENKCRICLEKDSLCLDFDNDGITDECWCPKDENCGKKLQYKHPIKSFNKNIDISISLYDALNNKPIQDGGSVFVGDQLLIDIKSPKKELGLDMAVENCSLTAITNNEDTFVENVNLIYRGCPVLNEITPVSLNFRQLSDLHLQSNLMEVFKLKSSNSILFTCWVRICLNKCEMPGCTDNKPNNIAKTKIKLLANESEFVFKEAAIQIQVDDPFGINRKNTQLLQNPSQLPHVIELQLKSKPFSGIIKATIVSAIAIVFAMIVSIISIKAYNSFSKNYMHRSMDRTENTESMCQTTESCKYEMNSRNYGDSYFQDRTDHGHDAGRW
ncbi:unnamed protein product [Brachionus calyciflorus]|uniref:ZP domain-containing protein n=1 Tax=Brachionus calyciflorus TaxID=104777 RepID=A0A813Z2P8_9BILA|nr:unnamed protein product [Brachionus calyciflorus]